MYNPQNSKSITILNTIYETYACYLITELKNYLFKFKFIDALKNQENKTKNM